MKLSRISILCVAMVAASMSAYGNMVISTGTGTAAWFGPATAEENGGEFWDNSSQDNDGNPQNSPCNVGFWLQSTDWNALSAACNNDIKAGSSGPGKPLAFLGSGMNGSRNVGWEFEASGQQRPVQLRVEVAGQRNTNVLGWYIRDTTTNVITDHILFNGPDDPSTIISKNINVSAGTTFGFYLCPAGNCANLYRSGTMVDVNPANSPRAGRFALFSEEPVNPTMGPPQSSITKYWVGVEDRTYGNSAEGLWGDYNDMIFSVQVVPEPGFYGVLALGLAALAARVTRRKNEA